MCSIFMETISVFRGGKQQLDDKVFEMKIFPFK